MVLGPVWQTDNYTAICKGAEPKLAFGYRVGKGHHAEACVNLNARPDEYAEAIHPGHCQVVGGLHATDSISPDYSGEKLQYPKPCACEYMYDAKYMEIPEAMRALQDYQERPIQYPSQSFDGSEFTAKFATVNEGVHAKHPNFVKIQLDPDRDPGLQLWPEEPPHRQPGLYPYSEHPHRSVAFQTLPPDTTPLCIHCGPQLPAWAAFPSDCRAKTHA